MKKRILILLLLVIQINKMYGGPYTELQAGFSYNTLRWRVANSPFTPDYTFSRNKLTIQPCFRFTVHYNIYVKDSIRKVTLSTFVGAHIFGGKSKDDTSSYKDKFAFYSCEAGFYPSFYLHRAFSLGIGFKLNYTPLVMQRNFGTLNQSDDRDRQWYREIASDRFKKFSSNVGIVARYKINRYSIGAEVWFGLTDLNKISSTIFSITVKENNYRLMLGYQIRK